MHVGLLQSCSLPNQSKVTWACTVSFASDSCGQGQFLLTLYYFFHVSLLYVLVTVSLFVSVILLIHTSSNTFAIIFNDDDIFKQGHLSTLVAFTFPFVLGV